MWADAASFLGNDGSVACQVRLLLIPYLFQTCITRRLRDLQTRGVVTNERRKHDFDVWENGESSSARGYKMK